MAKVWTWGLALGLAAAATAPLFAACGEVSTAADTPGVEKEEQSFKPGEVVVWFDDGVSAEEIKAAVAAVGANVKETSSVTPTRVVVTVPTGEEDAYVATFRDLKDVKAADKNYILKTMTGGVRGPN